MKIKELIQHLSTFDEDLEVGVFDHFGKFCPMDTYDFTVLTLHQPTGDKKTALEVTTPYIGEEPD